MRSIQYTVRILSVCLALLIAQATYAINERYESVPMKSNQIAPDSIRTAKDLVFFHPALRRFKKPQLVESSHAQLMQKGEYLVPGVVINASTQILDEKNRKR